MRFEILCGNGGGLHGPTNINVAEDSLSSCGFIGFSLNLVCANLRPSEGGVMKKKKKAPVKKKAAKKTKAKPKKKKAAAKVKAAPKESPVGIVTHYFGHVNAAAITLKKPLKIGDTVHIKGHTTDLTVTISSMQIDHESVQTAKKGDSIGIGVPQKCREHDKVFLAKV